MSSNEIKIKVSSDTGGGSVPPRGGGKVFPRTSSTDQIKREASSKSTSNVGGTDLAGLAGQNLKKIFESLSKPIVNLTKTLGVINKNFSDFNRGLKNQKSFSESHPVMSKVGSIAKTAGTFGLGTGAAGLGMLGFAASKIFATGEAYLQKIAEQKQTVGLTGGLQTRHLSNLTASETAQYRAATRRAGLTLGESDFSEQQKKRDIAAQALENAQKQELKNKGIDLSEHLITEPINDGQGTRVVNRTHTAREILEIAKRRQRYANDPTSITDEEIQKGMSESQAIERAKEALKINDLPSIKRKQKEFEETEMASQKYRRATGADIEQVATVMGRLGQGESGKSFSRIYESATKATDIAQTPKIIEAMSATLEQAITSGVNHSDLADIGEQFADRVGKLQSFSGSRDPRAAIAMINQFNQARENVKMGRADTTASWLSFRTAREMIGGKENETTEEFNARKKMLTELGYEGNPQSMSENDKIYYAQLAQDKFQTRIQEKITSDIYKESGGDKLKFASSYRARMGDTNINQIEMMRKQQEYLAMDENDLRKAKIKEELDKNEKMNIESAQKALKGSRATDIGTSIEQAGESRLFQFGAQAAQSTKAMSDAMDDIVKNLREPITEGLRIFATGIQTGGTAINDFVTRLTGLINGDNTGTAIRTTTNP